MLTPQEEALNNQLCTLPVIIDLKAKDAEIIDDLEGLKVGQESLSQTVSEGFAKGKVRMDGIEEEVRKLSETLRDGLKDVISEVRDQKLSELKNELKDRKSSDNSLKNDMIKIIVVSVLGVIGYLFVKAFG